MADIMTPSFYITSSTFTPRLFIPALKCWSQQASSFRLLSTAQCELSSLNMYLHQSDGAHFTARETSLHTIKYTLQSGQHRLTGEKDSERRMGDLRIVLQGEISVITHLGLIRLMKRKTNLGIHQDFLPITTDVYWYDASILKTPKQNPLPSFSEIQQKSLR